MTSPWRHSRLTYYDLGPNCLTQGVKLLPGEVWQVSKRNSQYFRSYLWKTTGALCPPPPPAGRGLTLARIRCFTTFGRTGGVGGGAPPPLGVSKRSVVELSGKDQQIDLAEYSRLVVLFLVLGQYLTQLWQVKGQIFGNSMIFKLTSPYQQNYLS